MSDHGRGLGRASALFGKKIHEVQTPTTGTKSCHSCMTVSYLQFQTEFDQLPVSASAMVVMIIFSVISCGSYLLRISPLLFIIAFLCFQPLFSFIYRENKTDLISKFKCGLLVAKRISCWIWIQIVPLGKILSVPQCLGEATKNPPIVFKNTFKPFLNFFSVPTIKKLILYISLRKIGELTKR